jgi:hypothetical protein
MVLDLPSLGCIHHSEPCQTPFQHIHPGKRHISVIVSRKDVLAGGIVGALWLSLGLKISTLGVPADDSLTFLLKQRG